MGGPRQGNEPEPNLLLELQPGESVLFARLRRSIHLPRGQRFRHLRQLQRHRLLRR